MNRLELRECFIAVLVWSVIADDRLRSSLGGLGLCGLSFLNIVLQRLPIAGFYHRPRIPRSQHDPGTEGNPHHKRIESK